MSRRTIVLAIVVAALLGTNLLWAAYVTLDTSVSETYARAELDDRTREACQARQLLARLGGELPRERVLSAARQVAGEEGFAKEGGVHVGALSFYFDASGSLEKVTSTIAPDPCSLEAP